MQGTEPHTQQATPLPAARLLHEAGPGPEDLTPERFLHAAGAWPRGYWARGDHWFAWAGEISRLEQPACSGPLAVQAAEQRFEELRRRAEALAAGSDADPTPLRFHGGLSFSSDRTGSGAWEGFPSYRFTLPMLEAAVGPGGVQLKVCFAAGDGAGPLRDRDRLLSALGAHASPRVATSPAAEANHRPVPTVVRVQEPLGKPAWNGAVERILARIEGGRVRKVVLARTLEVTLREIPNTLELLRRLREANPRGYAFFLEPAPGRVFFGAAPELLGALAGRAFHSTAVAGTIRRGRTPSEDEALARKLLASEKDRAEHRIVVEDMCERLAGVAAGACVDRAPRVVRLNRVQHLRTDVTVRLPADGHVVSLVGALHPSAAVCGHPREPADSILRREEAFARGWYAAPVGWFDGRGDGEFAPGLRSAVLQENRLRLFAGAGIVRGSEPHQEWEETRLKFDPILQLLGAPSGS